MLNFLSKPKTKDRALSKGQSQFQGKDRATIASISHHTQITTLDSAGPGERDWLPHETDGVLFPRGALNRSDLTSARSPA
jgi:hypothetical protein